MDNTARIQLVGGVKVGASLPGDYSFYGNLFGRMTKEVRNTGNLTRYLAFDYLSGENDPITILGIARVIRVRSQHSTESCQLLTPVVSSVDC